jgi:small subunit ribosomal protein S13
MAEFRHFVRVAGTDLKGDETITLALTGMKGIGMMLARSIVLSIGRNPRDKMGYLEEEDVAKIEKILENPLEYGIPVWMLMETGSDIHVVSSKLAIALREDVNTMRKARSYRGIRHESGLPVRGQRTKSSFRTGSSLGVRRKKKSEK